MSKDTVKIGVMPPLTGLVSIYGEEISQAAQIACAEVNQNGGILGKPLELIIEDDGSLPESSVAAAEKLIDQHHCVAIIGNLLSNSRIAVAYRVAEPRKVPYLNFSFYEGSILSHYFFHFAALPNQQIDGMIPYMLQNFGPRMFFAGNNYEWPRGSIHAAKLALKLAGGEVVGEEYCPIGVDAEAIELLLDQIEKAAPDVFVPYFAGVDQVNLLTRFTQRGLKKHIAVVMGHYDEMMASRLPAEVREDFYSCNTYFMSLDTAENKSYLNRLSHLPDVSGIWPEGNGILTNFGEGTYICIKAFAQAANLAGTLDTEALVTALKTIQVLAPQGAVQMNPTHHHAQVNSYLTRCDSKGVFKIIKSFGTIEPELPERYKHQLISQRATLEDDIRLQSRILEQMSEGVLLVSTQDAKILYTNLGADNLFGYDEGEMIGLPISKLNNPRSSKSAHTITELIGILNQKGKWQGELYNIKKDGTSIWCSMTALTFTHPLYAEVWLIVGSDISERKEMVMALQAKSKALESEATKRIIIEDELRIQQVAYKEAQSIAKIGHWQRNLRNDQLIWSDETYNIFEIDQDKVNPTLTIYYNSIHPEDLEQVRLLNPSSLQQQPYDTTFRLQLKDGRIKYIKEICEIKLDSQNNQAYSMGTVQDITKEYLLTEELKISRNKAKLASEDLAIKNQSLRLMEEVFSKASEAILVTNYKNEIIETNSSFEKISGYLKEEILGKNPSAMSSGKHDKEFYHKMWKEIHQNKHWQGEIWDRRKSGQIYPKDMTITKLEYDDPKSTKYVAIFTDITNQKISEERLNQLAYFDALTGLANRALCVQELSSRLKNNIRKLENLALLFIDLDGFKAVNDTMGHKIGDEVLMFAADQFQKKVRASDIVCRYGGDEFIVILSEIESAQMSGKVASKLIDVFKEPVQLSNGKEAYLNCSIGISFSPLDAHESADMIRYADAAMYEAKQAGKGRYHFFSKEIEDRAQRRMYIEGKLHRAIENHEFIVHYQPQVNSLTGKTTGVESLVRWNNPEAGLIPPAEFIPIAEKSELINDIGEFVLLESCRQNKEWQDRGICEVVISVNCSMRQFEERNMPSQVLKVLKDTGLEAKYLKIEVTESMVMKNSVHVIAQLQELRKIGVGVSIDDFGTGYSSLSIIRTMPLTDLKIDKAFINNITTDNMIPQVIVDLSKNMKLQTIAEGAEEWDQIESLHVLGCHTIQGFFYSKPLAKDDFEEFIKKGGLPTIQS